MEETISTLPIITNNSVPIFVVYVQIPRCKHISGSLFLQKRQLYNKLRARPYLRTIVIGAQKLNMTLRKSE